MTTSLANIRQDIRDGAHSDRLANTALFPNATVDLMINRAYKAICTRIQKYNAEYLTGTATLSLTGGQRYFDLPADCLAVLRVQYGSNAASRADLDPVVAQVNMDNLATGDPERYQPDGSKCYISPAPAATQTNYILLTYVKGYAKLTADASLITLPDRWREPIGDLAAAACMRWKGLANWREAWALAQEMLIEELESVVGGTFERAGDFDDRFFDFFE